MLSQVVLRWKCCDEFSWDLSWVIFGCDYILSDYGESFYVAYDDGTEVEFTFVPGISRKVHKLV